MNKKKGIIIIAVLCLIVGTIFFLKFQTTEKNYEIASSEINSIVVYDSYNQVNVIPSADDEIHVTYHDRSSSGYTITVEDGVLSISNKSESSGNGVNAGINFSNTSLTIEVPLSFTGDFMAKTFDTCTVDDSLNFSNVDVESLSAILGG